MCALWFGMKHSTIKHALLGFQLNDRKRETGEREREFGMHGLIAWKLHWAKFNFSVLSHSRKVESCCTFKLYQVTRLGRPKFCPCFLWPLLALFSGRKTHCNLTRQRTHGSANTASVRSFRALKSLSCVPARHDRPITYHSNPYYYSGSQTLISEYAGAQRQGPWTPSRLGRF